MAQYCSNTPDILSFMGSYRQTFHRAKDIFLEFCTSRAIHAKPNRLDREPRELNSDHHAKEVYHRSVTNSCRLSDQDWVARSNQRADLIRRKNLFNFTKMRYLTHFASHVRRFRSILMHSTELSELADKGLTKAGYRSSNKNEAARQILSHYGRHYSLGITLQTIEAHSKVEGVIVVEDSRMEMPTVSSRSTPRWVLKGRMKNTSTLTELGTAHDIPFSNMMDEILCFIKQTGAADW